MPPTDADYAQIEKGYSHFPALLLLYFVGKEVELLPYLLLCEAVEGEFCRGAHLSIALDCGLHEGNVSLHLADVDAYLHPRAFRGRYGTLVLDIEVRGHARGLHLAGDDPPCRLVDERGLYAAVQRVGPSLKVLFGLPVAYHLVAILVKLHVQAVLIARRTGKAVIALREAHPLIGVDDPFHSWF